MNLSIFPTFTLLYQGCTSHSPWANLNLGWYDLHAKNRFLFLFIKVVKIK